MLTRDVPQIGSQGDIIDDYFILLLAKVFGKKFVLPST